MDVVDRFLGKKTADGNGHLPEDAGLITDSAALTSQRTPWQSVQLARELHRPHSMQVIDGLFERFQELHGDRGYRDDPAIIGGIAELDGVGPVVVVSQQRGSTTEENIARSFGMPYPEGYRKAIRLYRMAEKFHLPLVTLVDTPGAYPGPEAEERGQAEAIAKSIATMCGLQTPIVAIILGEGGSGGALALAVGDVVLALQNAIYSVISPEGAAATPAGRLNSSSRSTTSSPSAAPIRAATTSALSGLSAAVPPSNCIHRPGNIRSCCALPLSRWNVFIAATRSVG